MSEEERKMREAASKYLDQYMGRAGGIAQAADGFYRKILPSLLGVGKKFSWAAAVQLLLKLVFFVAVAGFPIVTRKATAGGSHALGDADAATFAAAVYSRWDRTDSWLFIAAVLLAGLPRAIEKFSHRRATKVPELKSSHHLANALDASPFVKKLKDGEQIQSAIDHALQALLIDLRGLIEEGAKDPFTEITLLEFCGQGGGFVRVRSRSDISERSENHRPVESWRFLAYYVAQRGNWFAEHNFLGKKNPFPKRRLTVRGAKEVTYRSVLYLPIMRGRVDPTFGVVDECLGVVCVHSAQPYRFWQWGDHNYRQGKFGNVAFNKALPYIALMSKLLSATAQPLVVENR